MFKVEKKNLVEAQRVISKVIKDLNTVYLLTSTKEKTLWLIANEPTHYIKTVIPDAEVTAKGLVGLKAEVFSSILSMRGDTFEASYDKENSKLDVVCGSKNSVYVLDVEKDAIVREKEDVKFIGIPSKKVAMMREMFKAFVFATPDANPNGSAVFKNTKDSMSVRYATVNTCAFYETSEPIAKKEFEVTVTMAMVMDILSVVSSEAKVAITDSAFILESDTVEASIPTVEDETKGYAEFYETLKDAKQFIKGKVILCPKKVLPALGSVRATSGGTDLVKVSFNGNKGTLYLESKNGTGSDKFEVESNSLGKISVEIPETYLYTTLSTASTSSDKVTLQIGTGKNLYKLIAKNDAYSFMTVGPISS